jgi:general secretion pathway protein G
VQPSLTFLVILGILAMLVYVIILPTSYHGGGEDRTTAAYADIHGGIKTALDCYRIDNGFYPKSLNDLIQQPSSTTNWHGPYLDNVPIDPWGHKYIYEFPGKHDTNSYDLMSAGPDGKRGTDDDIGNWTTK